MEGKKIYDDSYAELSKIRKSLGSDSTTINWDKLDGETKSQLLQSIREVTVKRSKDIEKVILGVQ